MSDPLIQLFSEVLQVDAAELSEDSSPDMVAPDNTASWYVRRDEQREAARAALASALRAR